MAAITRADAFNPVVPTLPDSAVETVDGKDPGMYRKLESNGYALSRELTPEISVALSSLTTPLLARLVKVLKCPTSGSRVSLIEAFQDAVIRSGVKTLVARLTRNLLKKVSHVCNVPTPKQRLLLDAILRIGLPVFLHEKCDVPMFVEFCAVLGLDSGRGLVAHASNETYASPILESPFGHKHPHPVSFGTVPLTANLPTRNSGQNNHSNGQGANGASEATPTTATPVTTTTLGIAPTATSKSSVELERELADELMLLGTEDLLRMLPGPLLQEICQELGLLAPFQGMVAIDALQLVDLIMDHIFDLVPFTEYTQLLHVQQQQLQVQHTRNLHALRPDNGASMDIDDSPTQNDKKRKRDDVASSADTTSPNKTPSKFASATTKQSEEDDTHFAVPTTPASKRTKLTEHAPSESTQRTSPGASSTHKSGASATPSDTDSANPGSSKNASSIVSPSPEVAKRPRGRPPNSSKQQSVTQTSPTAPAADNGRGSATTNKNTKSSPSKASYESDSEEEEEEDVGRRSRNASRNKEKEESNEEEEAEVSPLRRRGRPPMKRIPSQRAKKEESEESDEEEESSEDEPRHASGKGRAKYQAPPLSNIKKGITGQELHNLYNVTDLQDWCRQHQVDHTGKKSAVIKRILYELDPTSAKPPPPKKSRRFNSR